MPEGPFGGPRPFTETQEVWFNTTFNINKDPIETFGPDDPEYRQIIADYINPILDQQPEIDGASGDILIIRNDWAILESGGTTGYESALSQGREIVKVQDTVEVDMRFEEPTLVFSHVQDSSRIAERKHRRFQYSDTRVLPKGLLRDERDRMHQEDKIDVEIPTTSIIR